MSSLEKLVRKALYHPEKVTYPEAERLLRALGYALKKTTGSHRAFHQAGRSPIILVTEDSLHIKKEYVRLLAKSLDLEEWLESRE